MIACKNLYKTLKKKKKKKKKKKGKEIVVGEADRLENVGN
jgi:hypothetical protein